MYDREKLLRLMRTEAEQGRSTELVTVVRTEGPSPGKCGAAMLVGRSGRLAGTVGGGALEYRAEQTARGLLAAGESRTEKYDLAETGENPVGMACGGSAVLEYRFIGASAPVPEELLPGSAERGRERALIFGGGHIAEALVPILASVGFSVTVWDDREAYAAGERFPAAAAVHCGAYSDIGRLDPGPDDYAVVVTHGHVHDLETEAQLLGKNCGYVGVIGSRRKKAAAEARLREAGFSEEILRTVRMPVGLDIGAESPEEIAVSIAAEMILCRSRRRGGKPGNDSPFTDKIG